MKNTTISLLLLLWIIPLFAQAPWTEFTYDRVGTHLVFNGDDLWVGTNGGGVYRWNTISNEYQKFSRVNNGLSDNFINDLAIDTEGNIWVATNHGLSKYDGNTWNLFNQSNSALPERGIMSLATDPNGKDLWVGTFEHGLFKFDGITWTNFTVSNSNLSDNFVTSIEIEPDGTLWIGAWGDGIDEFNGTEWIHHPGAFWVKAAATNNIWAWSYSETFGGFVAAVHQYNGADWTTYNEANSDLISDLVSSIAIAPNGEVWFGTNTGISVFDGENWRDYTDIQSLVDLNFSNQKRIAIKGDGAVWFGTDSGISTLENTNFIAYQTDGLADNVIADIEIGMDNGVWLATRGGLQVLSDSVWTTYTPTNSLIQAFDIKALALDQSGAIWVGAAQSGLSRFDGENWTLFNTENSGLFSNAATSIVVDKTNNKWIGSRIFGSRVSRLEGNTWNDFDIGFSSLRGRTIAADTLSGAVWFATNEGAWQYSQPVWTKFTTEDGLVDDRVTSIAVDIDGSVWFGTFGGGICKFDGNEWTTFFSADGGTIASINDIAIGADGTKWFATQTFGVKKFDGNTWTDYNWQDGLINDRVYSIAIDQDNNKWFGTDFGVSVFNDSSIISSNETLKENYSSGLHIYPNPSRGKIQVEFLENLKQPVFIQVFNLMGQIVFEEKSLLPSKEVETLDLSTLTKGAYFVKIQVGTNIQVKKVVIK